MICYRCGAEIGKYDYCPECSADVAIFQRVIRISNSYYNEGLENAQVKNMSGAIVSLRKSLKFYKYNIDARNLLGLVYYEIGETVAALGEWVISANYQKEDNAAVRYLREVHQNRGQLESVNQTIKKYNQAIVYCKQGSRDLAIIQLKKVLSLNPKLVKGHQLLALLYLQEGQYEKAKKALRNAGKIDADNTLTLKYLKETNRKLKEKGGNKKQENDDLISYQSGNETIIQPVASGLKDNVGLHTMINIAIGVAVGVAVMAFLVMPAVSASRQSKVNKQTVKFSDQIATQKSQISALKKELETYRTDTKAAEEQKQTAEATKSSYESLMTVVSHYSTGDMSNSELAEELLKINAGTLGTSGKEEYDSLAEKIYPRVCESLYATSQKNYQVANYDMAVTNLEQVVQMDEGYQDGEAMLLLAQSYEKQGEQDKANAYYQKIIEEHEGTQAATDAQEALDTQNAQKSKKNNN